MKVSFVIPLYNEVNSLKQLYQEIIAQFTELNEHSLYEIIFIDDGSDDDSLAVLSNIAANDEKVKIVSFRRNFGKSAALQYGFSLVGGDCVFTMDSDLQDNPSEIGAMLEQLKEGTDLVSGWKKKRYDPLIRKVASYLFNLVTSILFGKRLHDYNCGYKLYRSELIKELDIYGELHRYIPVIASAKGYRVTELQVEHRAREYGKSKFGIERYLRGFFDLLTVKLITGYTRSPLYLFGGLGSLFSSLGIVIGLYLSVMKLFYGMPLSNRPLLIMSTLLVMIGLQFFSVGLIGELVVNQTRPLNKNSTVSVKKSINLKNNE